MRLSRPSLVLALVALVGCSEPAAPTTDLVIANARWERAKLDDYMMTVTRSCECTSDMTGPVDVLVLNRVVQSRTYSNTGAAVPAGLAEEFPSVEGLFAIIGDAIQRKAYKVEVDFDEELGYPRRVFIDYNKQMADDEITWTLTRPEPPIFIY